MSEGYGLNPQALERIKASGAGLVITVDCGISAAREAQVARSLGLDLIITDHHEINGLNGSSNLNSSTGSLLPDAYAILHPWLLAPDAPAATRDRVSGLTGVGIAYKLAQALLGVSADDDRLTQYLDHDRRGERVNRRQCAAVRRPVLHGILSRAYGETTKARSGSSWFHLP